MAATVQRAACACGRPARGRGEECHACHKRRRRAEGHVSQPRDVVPNAPIREAVLDSGVPLGEIAARMGLEKKDTSRIARRLGLADDSGSNGQMYRSRNIRRPMAVAIIRALHLYPVDFDL
jgi:hypothetical protein